MIPDIRQKEDQKSYCGPEQAGQRGGVKLNIDY